MLLGLVKGHAEALVYLLEGQHVADHGTHVQALLHDPAALFLDEPGSNLDPAGKQWLGEYARGLAEAGKTVVLATNDRDEMNWGHNRVALAG